MNLKAWMMGIFMTAILITLLGCPEPTQGVNEKRQPGIRYGHETVDKGSAQQPDSPPQQDKTSNNNSGQPAQETRRDFSQSSSGL